MDTNLDIESIKELLRRVIEYPIELQEFYDLCNEEWEEHPYFSLVIDNVESLLEHAPGKFLSLEINLDRYKSSEEHRIACIDLDLIENNDTNDVKNLIIKRNTRLRSL